jgi:hypothetical protein
VGINGLTRTFFRSNQLWSLGTRIAKAFLEVFRFVIPDKPMSCQKADRIINKCDTVNCIPTSHLMLHVIPGSRYVIDMFLFDSVIKFLSIQVRVIKDSLAE